MSEIEERLYGESPKAREAFVCYRDMGVGRSIAQAGRVLKKSGACISKWAAKYNWKKRIDAWDTHQEFATGVPLDLSEAYAAVEEPIIATKEDLPMTEIAHMRRRHIRIAEGFLYLVRHELERRRRDLEEAIAKGEAYVLSDRTLKMFCEMGTQLERLNRGEPGEIHEHRNITAEVKDELTSFITSIAARQRANPIANLPNGPSDSGSSMDVVVLRPTGTASSKR